MGTLCILDCRHLLRLHIYEERKLKNLKYLATKAINNASIATVRITKTQQQVY